jgi:UDP-2,4-diacetamido-2,4,6-trideoxy-beta-L-altropyranose hydrolase
MNVVFRTDASEQIGAGHFMRCMSLAEELQKFGGKILFVSYQLPQHMRDMLRNKNMGFVQLKSNHPTNLTNELTHSHWLDLSQTEDADQTKKILRNQKWDLIVVDHYALDFRWETSLRSSVSKIIVIDDIADRKHDCDFLIDQNHYESIQERYSGLVPPKCCLLLGPRYALLRNEFHIARSKVVLRSGPVKRILVSFGGMDFGNYTVLTINALAELKSKSFLVDVVVGFSNPYKEEIISLCNQYKFLCHIQTSQISELMVISDFAIGAGGITIWERCCLGLPTLVLCVAENQSKQIKDAAEKGLIFAPKVIKDLSNQLKLHINSILENESLRTLISKTAINEVDGLGLRRVAVALNSTNIQLRIANESDLQNIFDWRNHPSIRKMSSNSNVITWNDHVSWYKNANKDGNKLLLIVEIVRVPIGVVRFDLDNTTALISIYTAPDEKNKGYGKDILIRAEEWLNSYRSDVKNIHAEVLGQNTNSQSMFSKANYYIKSVRFSKEISNHEK